MMSVARCQAIACDKWHKITSHLLPIDYFPEAFASRLSSGQVEKELSQVSLGMKKIANQGYCLGLEKQKV